MFTLLALVLATKALTNETSVAIKEEPYDKSGITHCSPGYFPAAFKFAGMTQAYLKDTSIVRLSSPCFRKTEVQVTEMPSEANDWVVSIEIHSSKPNTLFCSDNYIFTTLKTAHTKAVFFRGKKHIKYPLDTQGARDYFN